MRERSRRASLQPDYSWLSVDAGSDLENKESSAPSARLSWLRIMQSTHRAAAHHAGLGCFDEKKYHLKRRGTSLRCQTRVWA